MGLSTTGLSVLQLRVPYRALTFKCHARPTPATGGDARSSRCSRPPRRRTDLSCLPRASVLRQRLRSRGADEAALHGRLPSRRGDRLIARNLPEDRWTIVDLRPLRASFARISATLRPDQQLQFRRLVFGFDAASYIGGMHPGDVRAQPGRAVPEVLMTFRVLEKTGGRAAHNAASPLLGARRVVRHAASAIASAHDTSSKSCSHDRKQEPADRADDTKDAEEWEATEQ